MAEQLQGVQIWTEERYLALNPEKTDVLGLLRPLLQAKEGVHHANVDGGPFFSG